MLHGRRWLLASGAILLLLVALALLWDWNWFRPLVERRIGTALGRRVTLGRFDVQLSRQPLLLLDDITVDNPAGFAGPQPMAHIDRLVLRFDLPALRRHQLDVVQIDLQHPVAELATDPAGTNNWTLAKSPAGSSGAASRWQLSLRELRVEDGHVHLDDPRLKSDFRLEVHTQPGGTIGGRRAENLIYIGADGRYAGQAIHGRFTGGSILGLRDPKDPYPFDLQLAHGATRVALQGSLLDPLKFGGAALKLDLGGEDLAALYPLTGIPFAPTPPYHLSGQLDYVDHRFRFRDFAGSVGSSDLEGEIDEAPGRERPRIEGDLRSRHVLLADLAGFIGGAPGSSERDRLSPRQQAEHARQQAEPRLIPDKPINLPELRSADLDIRYQAQRIDSQSTPLDNIVARLRIDHGALSLQPLAFGVGQGDIALNLRLEPHGTLIHTTGDIEFHRVDLARLMQATHRFSGAGTIGGSARIDTTGNSLAQMLGRGDGELKLFMSGGKLSAVLVDLAGLDFGNGLVSALGLPSQAQLRCMVSDFSLAQGVLDTRVLLFDTSEANIIGDGKLNLAEEQIDYRLSTQPKHFSIGHLRAPILISGPLKSPSIRPDEKQLALRGSLATALGVLATPLAALLPTIELGLGKDHDCAALVESVGKPAAVPGGNPSSP